jgi:predicted RNA-binding Zn-ribbon protein involved in translation (DUF1610 family)
MYCSEGFSKDDVAMNRDYRRRCPNCGAPIDRVKTDAKRTFPCPNCGQNLELSKTAMRICSVLVLFLSVIAPVGYGLRGWPALAAGVFLYGSGLTLVGVYFYIFTPAIRITSAYGDIDSDSPITLDLTPRAKSDRAESSSEGGKRRLGD